MEDQVLSLRRSGEVAISQYLLQRPISTGNKEIDEVLEGGIESGNFYLFLGSAKNGKSTVLRCLGIKLAEKYPVLYVNFEQMGRNVLGKIYQLRYGKSLREEVHLDIDSAYRNVKCLPDLPFFLAFWTDELVEKSFNRTVAPMLKKSIDWITQNDPEKRKPVVFLENLSDIYNERIHATDNVVNIVTQTAQDIKNFMIANDCCCFLAHHTGKIQGDEPSMDDVRDSKRVVDLAHSVFSAYVRLEMDALGNEKPRYCLKYIAGRGAGTTKKWDVHVNGLNMNLVPIIGEQRKTKKY
jgi:predicted ATP-dependent serine protease